MGQAVICTACGSENREGRKFCSRCGASLHNRCPGCGASNDPDDRFCAECGASLGVPAAASGNAVATPQPGQYAAGGEGVEERRIATVLFADLAGFTSMSEGLDPEDVKALATHCSGVMSAEVRRFGGTVTGIMGDAIMATFGAPLAHEDDAERAVRAALAMRGQIRAQNLGPARLDLHIGINTGETMAGLIGPQGRQDYVAMGDTTNTAARMMSHAPTGSIYVGEQTYLDTRHSIVYRAGEPIAAKGKAEPVRVWEVLEAPPVPQPRPLGSAPFVGRRPELATVTELWERVRREHRACSLTVAGAPGIGKSRMLREAASRLEGDPLVLWGRCLPYGEGITYWPVVEMVVSAARITHDDGVETKLDKLGRLVESLPTDDEDQAQSIATALCNLLALPSTPRGALLAAQISRGELHWGIRRFLELLGTRARVAIVFEDLHWSEPTLLELITYLKDAATPLLILATTRPEGLAVVSQADLDRDLVIRLGGLTDEEATEVLSGLIDGTSSDPALDPLLRAAGGNPLFLEETLRMLASSGALGGEKRTREALEEMPIPTSVHGLIGSRLDLLPPDEKRMAQHGAVIGHIFWSGAVAYVGGWSGTLDDRLEDLGRREVVEPHQRSQILGDHEYEFKHMLIRDVAYSRLPKRERAELHAACARWLGQQLTQRDEVIEIIAYHWEQACRQAPRVGPATAERPVEQAIESLMAAAIKAENRDGGREAQRFYERALALVDATRAGTAAELHVRHARATEMLGALADAEAELAEAATEADRLGRGDLRGQALATLAHIHVKQGLFRDAERELVEVQRTAADLGDRELQLRAAYELAELHGGFEGKTDLGIDELRRARPIAESLGDRALLFEGHTRMATLLFNVGKLREAEAEAAQAEQLALAQGSHRDRARAAFIRGIVSLYRAGPEVARPIAADALKWNERVGDYYYQLQSVRSLAKCELSAGSPEDAAAQLRDALPLAGQAGGWLAVEIRRCLVESLVALGELSEAATVASQARAAMPPEDEYALAAVLLSEALVSVAGTDPGGAWNAFAEALRIMETLQLWLDHGEAQVLHARALARAGLRTQAVDELSQARALFRQLQADASAADVDRELARLGAEVSGPA